MPPFHADFYKSGQYGPRFNDYFLNQFLFYANNAARAEFKAPGSMFRVSKDGRLYLTPQFMGMLGYRMSRSLTDQIVKAAAKSSVRAMNGPAAFAAGLGEASKGDKRRIRQANDTIALAMRTAVAENYGRTVERRKQVPSYRIGQGRYAGGALRRALQSPDMAVGTNDGILFVNQDRLNLEARHWARLNFGVAPAQTPASYQGKLTFGGKTIGTVGFRAQPRPPMFLPAGFWNFVQGKISAGPRVPAGGEERLHSTNFGDEGGKVNFGVIHGVSGPTHRRRVHGKLPGGESYTTEREFPTLKGAQPVFNNKRGWRDNYGSYTKSGVRSSRQGFYPLSGAPRYPTRGIVGVNYLDIGFKTLVERFELEYENVVKDWVRSATSGQRSKSPAGKAVVKYVLSLDPHAPIETIGFKSPTYTGFGLGRAFGRNVK